METNKKYDIEEFYVGELYLYTNFANFISKNYNPKEKDKVKLFSQTKAINFQQDEISRQIDWEEKREYTGFLTIFYKQGNKYICLHDGVSYEINGAYFIKNLIPLNELLPKVNTKILSKISIYKALELFDILFKTNQEEIHLYNDKELPIREFYVGDLILKEISYQESSPESGYSYINLPHHIMLNNNNLAIQSFQESEYINTKYRCLFLKDGVDLYNINNHQFYNPNEDSFEMLINFRDYITGYEIKCTQELISIPKALKKFRRTL